MTGPGPVRESLVGKPPPTAPLPVAAKPAAAAAPRGGHGRTLMGVGVEQSAELRALIEGRKDAPAAEATMPATRRLSDELPGPATSVMGGAPPYTAATAAPPIEEAPPKPTALRIQDLPQAVVAPPQREELLATKPSAPPPEQSGETISSRSRGEPAISVEVAGATPPAVPISGESPTAPSPAIPREPAQPYASTVALPAMPMAQPAHAAAPPAPAYTPPAAQPAAVARPVTPHASPFTAYAPSASQPRPERSSSALRLGLLTALLVAAGVLIALRSGWLDGLLGTTPTPTTPATADATVTAAPTAAETAAPAPTDTPTAAPSAAPSGTPSAAPSAVAGDPAALAFDRGYLVVNTPVEAHVYVNGRYAGPSNQPVEAPCGSRYVRIAKPENPPGLKGPASWLADGKPVGIGCKATTTVEMKPGPPSRPAPAPGGATPGGATPPGGGTAAPTAQPTPEPAPTE
jgi:hypothetical protein